MGIMSSSEVRRNDTPSYPFHSVIRAHALQNESFHWCASFVKPPHYISMHEALSRLVCRVSDKSHRSRTANRRMVAICDACHHSNVMCSSIILCRCCVWSTFLFKGEAKASTGHVWILFWVRHHPANDWYIDSVFCNLGCGWITRFVRLELLCSGRCCSTWISGNFAKLWEAKCQ